MQGSHQDPQHLLSRRTALRGAAGMAGAAWLVPVVTIVSMDAASAASAPPPGGGQSGGGQLNDQGSSTRASSSLAFTGSDATEAAVVGMATLATGAAAIVAARRLRRTEPSAVPHSGRHRAEGDTDKGDTG